MTAVVLLPRSSVAGVDWSAFPRPCCYHLVWVPSCTVTWEHRASYMVAQDSWMPRYLSELLVLWKAGPAAGTGHSHHWALVLSFKGHLSVASGQVSCVTEEIRKVLRGQIIWGITDHGEDFGCFFFLSVIGSHWRLLRSFEQRMAWHNLCFTKITLQSAMRRSGCRVIKVETGRPGGRRQWEMMAALIGI